MSSKLWAWYQVLTSKLLLIHIYILVLFYYAPKVPTTQIEFPITYYANQSLNKPRTPFRRLSSNIDERYERCGPWSFDPVYGKVLRHRLRCRFSHFPGKRRRVHICSLCVAATLLENWEVLDNTCRSIIIRSCIYSAFLCTTVGSGCF